MTKKSRKRRKKNAKKYLIVIGMMLCVLLAFVGKYYEFDAKDAIFAYKSDHVISTIEGELTAHFIDVGQADCILFLSGGQSLLIDAGNNADADTIVAYLQEQGITKLDYVIGTHPHADHIGSLDTVILNFAIGTVILPEKVHTTQTFENVLDAIEEKELTITKPVVGDEYQLGEATFTIIAPNKDYGDNLNDWSVGVIVTYGSNRFLLCGDAETDAEADILANSIRIDADVLKVSHHGSNSSTSEEFLKAVNPAYAVILVGEDNQYGHPHDITLELLKESNVEIFRTDESGTIVAASDGTTIMWRRSKDETGH